jgi:hypothetical protein
MTQFEDKDEQAVWELIGRHRSIEPSFGFAQRTLRRLDEEPASLRPIWWQLPGVRWAVSLSLIFIATVSVLHWQRGREAQRSEVYAAAQQDSLEDFDVIANLDQLNGDNKL